MPLRSRLGSASDAPRRGVGSDRPAIPPLAQALVMGLGGSGIQTVSRVKSMIDSSFPEAAATSSVTFLGVDAVDLKLQNPPLPPGVSIAASDFFNLTETMFDPEAIVRSESTHHSPLQEWWDFNRKIAPGAQTEGLKQDRMLGRLAYYREGDRLSSRIAAGLRAAATLTARGVGAGQGGGGRGGARPRVYLAASMCGGTGSSGVLEALYRIWTASMGIGLTPEITLFLFMPGIFEGEAAKGSPNPAAEVANLRANAYGFLRELDHFIEHSDQLGNNLANPGHGAKVAIPAGHLVRQVFLIDSQLSSGQFLERIADSYEVAASAVYQLLMTRVGHEVAVNGVNMEQLLQEYDGHGKRRIYCGLGISCVTYPGETLRQHISHRFADWFVRDRLLATSHDLGERVRKDDETGDLLTSMRALHDEAMSFQEADRVYSYKRMALSAPDTLAGDNSEDTVTRLVNQAKEGRARAVSELRSQLDTYVNAAVARIDAEVVDRLMACGESIPFLTQALKHVIAQLTDLRAGWNTKVAHHQDAVARGDRDIDAARRTLAGVPGWRAWLGGRDNAAKDLGQAIQSYGKASLDQHRAQSSARFYSDAIAILGRLQGELERAELALATEAQRFSDAWHADELIGKDAGPRDLTALIPEDVQPEVEDSRLAKDAFRRVLAAVSAIEAGPMLKEFYQAWRGEDQHRGAFDLGSTSQDRVGAARRVFLAEVERLADAHALQAVLQEETSDGTSNLHLLYLPRSLEDAAARVDEGRALGRALVSMQALAGQVLLPVDVNKLRSDIGLSPSTVVSRPASLADEVAVTLPDTAGCRSYDWPDRERLQVFTTKWGASAHALSAVSTWRSYYDRALLLDSAGVRRPPHLARNWVDDLDPLEPSYDDLDLAADAVVHALLAGELLDDDAIRGAVFGEHAVRMPPGVPLKKEDLGVRMAWRGTTFVHDPATLQWRPRGQQFDFGASLHDLLANVAANPLFRQSNADFGAAIILKAGRDAAIKKLDPLEARLSGASTTIPAEAAAVHLLVREARELLAQLKHTAAIADF